MSSQAVSLSEVISVLSLQAGYNSAVVVVGATLLGIASGTIGVFALLRNRALMSDALAHSALPGLGLAFILGSLSGIGGKQLWLLLSGATISGVCGVLCVQFLTRYTRLQEDAAIGAVLSCFFGAGIVLLSVIQSLGTGEEGGLSHFIYGQTAAMNLKDAYYILVAAGIAVLTSIALLKEFRLVCFDEQFANSDGWPVSKIDLLMMSVIVLVTVIGLQSVGLLLIVAFLVIPPAASRFWTDKLNQMIWISALIGGLSGYLGSALSALLPRLPAGAIIVLVAGTLFFFSFFFAPARGLFAIAIRQTALRLRVLEDHILRAMYEQKELQSNNIDSVKLSFSSLPISRSFNVLSKSTILLWLKSRSLINYERSKLWLTPKGLELATRKVRNHRLWEEYLVTYAEIAVSHVDYSADLVEHVLSSEIVEKLEASVVRQSDTSSDSTPKSIHPISEKT